jgi:hypothetical protein
MGSELTAPLVLTLYPVQRLTSFSRYGRFRFGDSTPRLGGVSDPDWMFWREIILLRVPEIESRPVCKWRPHRLRYLRFRSLVFLILYFVP